ncbi:serine O-acetyltransferase [Synechococcus sp. PCC 7502]|uniref:serine O-acetyltransferase n=1 Tax=Synechococcus sp. PCC 7502 TaxID=1173263 RepID=UPI00029FC6C5|nr:serine O-acetyltransferase [Synechococcus sp. PCC 7502]AFY73357.1 serine O-acetyltransferase [Synechococcus sp. PCC 7502]
MLDNLIADFRVIFERDPAARSSLEVLLCYPGFHVLAVHRLCHWLYLINIPVLPRFIAYIVRFFTGVEIHPGAKIGKGVFIDHGVGVVIGETAIIGGYALIYQGVTLGGTGKEVGKRHPSIGENVILGAGAKILGNIEIGDRSCIGAGSVVLQSIPPDCTVVGVPGRIVRDRKLDDVNINKMPDPEAEIIKILFERIKVLEGEAARVPVTLVLNDIHGDGRIAEDQKERAISNTQIQSFLDGAGI